MINFIRGDALDKINFAILAGGNGNRLRPLCDAFTPKPFIEIAPGRSLLRHSFAQIKDVIRYRQRIVNCSVDDKVTLVVLEKFLNRALKEVDSQVDQTITEVATKNTFNAILRLVTTLDCDPGQMLCIVPCDQIIDDLEAFSQAICKAEEVARENSAICLIGTIAKIPSTQLGYIKCSEDGSVQAFVEKPAFLEAQELIGTGALVNTSTIVATVGVLKDAINKVSQRDDFVFNNESFDSIVLQKNVCSMFAIKSEHNFIDVGTPETFDQGKKFLATQDPAKSILLNQDCDACCEQKSPFEQGFPSQEAELFAEYNVRKIVKWLPALQNKKIKILDFGCGSGVSTELLRRYFIYANISGCDSSTQSINNARQNYPQTDFFTLGKNGQDLIPESYDLIVASEVFHHIDKCQRGLWLEKIKNALKKGGTLVLLELNPLNPFTYYEFKTNTAERDAKIMPHWQAKKLIYKVFSVHAKTIFYCFFQSWFKFLRPVESIISSIPLGGLYSCIVKKQ